MFDLLFPQRRGFAGLRVVLFFHSILFWHFLTNMLCTDVMCVLMDHLKCKILERRRVLYYKR